MGSIGGYIFRTTFGAFVVVLISVTMLMWLTQALRNIDLMTSQGQTILVFIGITGLIIPLLILMIAPIALMIAVAHVLNKLGNDSELIVMNSAGMRPWSIFSPFLAVSLVVALIVAAIAFYISPKCLQELRRWATEVRADVVANIVQPGRFTTLDGKLTLHIRERQPNGELRGILVDDGRNPKERMTILAEQGDILRNDQGVYLLLKNGTVHRYESDQRDPAIVLFDQYAFDLSRLSSGPPTITFAVHERYITELYDALSQPLPAAQLGAIRAEIHNRITAPLYPVAFLVVTFAYLGAPRTTRQSRALSLVAAVAVVSLVRGLGFFGTLAGVQTPVALALPYATLALVVVAGSWSIARGVIIEPPAFIAQAFNAMVDAVMRRLAGAMGQTT